MGPKGPNAVRVKMAPKAPPKPKVVAKEEVKPEAKEEVKPDTSEDTPTTA